MCIVWLFLLSTLLYLLYHKLSHILITLELNSPVNIILTHGTTGNMNSSVTMIISSLVFPPYYRESEFVSYFLESLRVSAQELGAIAEP